VIIPLDRTTVDNGCTELFPSYHTDLGIMDGDVYVFPPSLVDETKAVPLELHPGDLALMHCLTPHRSEANRTESWRRQLFLDYNARSDGGDCRAKYYADREEDLKRTIAKTGISNTYFL
jgi:ectoine hydroxylase-related dioxygenase (phytanoyl-CoA dioxygenase family)